MFFFGVLFCGACFQARPSPHPLPHSPPSPLRLLSLPFLPPPTLPSRVHVVFTAAPCDLCVSVYPEDSVALKKVNSASYDRFTGSCLRLYKNNDAGVVIYFVPGVTRSFPVLARSFCGYQNSGGRLASLNSLNTSANALLPLLKTLTAGASTDLVLMGGYQFTKLANGATFPKNDKWIWTDAYTNSSIIANGNWAAGQPEYVILARGACVGWRGRGVGA